MNITCTWLLEALLEDEINEREARSMDRHRVESALSGDKRLSSIDFAAVSITTIRSSRLTQRSGKEILTWPVQCSAI